MKKLVSLAIIISVLFSTTAFSKEISTAALSEEIPLNLSIQEADEVIDLLPDSELSLYEELPEASKVEIKSKLVFRDFKTAGDLQVTFEEQVLLMAINSIGDYSQVEVLILGSSLLTEEKELFLSLNEQQKQLVMKSLMGKNFGTLDQLKTAFSYAVTSSQQIISTPPSTVGGGGGGTIEPISYYLHKAVYIASDKIESTVIFRINPDYVYDFSGNMVIAVYNRADGRLITMLSEEFEISASEWSQNGEVTKWPVIEIPENDAENYIVKAIIIDSFDAIRPIGATTNPNSRYFVSNYDGTLMTVIGKIRSISLDKTAKFVRLEYYAIDAESARRGWTITDTWEEMANVPTNVLINGVDIKGLQGLRLEMKLEIPAQGTGFKLISATSLGGDYNNSVIVDPTLAANINDNGYVRYYKNITDDKTTALQIDQGYYSNMAVYVNWSMDYQTYGGYQSAVKAGNALYNNPTQTEYKYVDTDGDGIYDTVFVTDIQSFVVGSVNLASHRITRDMSMQNAAYNYREGASLDLDPNNENIDWSLKNEAGEEISLSEVKAGQVINIKQSDDGSYTYYDITVTDADISGVVTARYEEYNKVTQRSEPYYVINGQSYQTFYGLSMPEPGDMIDAKIAANGKIIAYKISQGQRNYGLIVGNYVDFGSEKIYQLQMLKADGAVGILNLNSKFNGRSTNYNAPEGSPTDPAGTSFRGDFKAGTLVVYELNSSNEIRKIAPAAGSLGGDDFMTLRMQLIGDMLNREYYNPRAERLSSYTITDDTVIFTTSDADPAYTTKNNARLGSKSMLMEDQEYNGYVISDSSREAHAVVLFDCSNSVRWDSYPMIITNKATRQVEGESRIQYTGYVNGNEVSATVTDDPDFGEFNVNDVILYALDGKGEIVAAERLAAYDSMGSYHVATNTNLDNPLNENNKGFSNVQGTYKYSLIARPMPDYEKQYSGYKNIAITEFSDYYGNSLTHQTIRGYAVAGKVYDYRNRNLQLMPGNAFSDTIDDYSGRDYNSYEADGYTLKKQYGLITDVYVDPSVPAYIFNGNTKTLRIGSIGDIETEVITADSWTSRFDNDDTIYIYKYDGDTYFILIIDADGR